MKCALPGCGREVDERQQRLWRNNRRANGQQRGGPYCSQECYADARKDAARKDRRRAEAHP